LLRTRSALYEPRTGASLSGNATDEPVTSIQQQGKISPMAVTPSKDYKRREREQRKLDKRMARDAAKEQQLEDQRVAAQAAGAEAFDTSEAGIQARLEAEFEAELEAERQSQMVA